MLTDSVRNQSRQIFQNIEIVLDAMPAEEFSSRKGGFATWKHLYHLIHSLDKNFIDPSSFAEPDFHRPNMDIIYLDTEPALTKSQVEAYYRAVRDKVQGYLEGLTDAKLEEVVSFRDLKLTRLELILAQLRHVFYHVGYLHCCLKMERGQTPEYIGIYKSKPIE
jgi:hypothetical protein